MNFLMNLSRVAKFRNCIVVLNSKSQNSLYTSITYQLICMSPGMVGYTYLNKINTAAVFLHTLHIILTLR